MPAVNMNSISHSLDVSLVSLPVNKHTSSSAGFLESLWRDIDLNRLQSNPSHELNLIIISHGLASRVFLMKWFKWTVEQFELLNNPENCEFRVMQLGQGGEYSLAIHHTEEEMTAWGLSPDMIADQQWRANAHRGDWSERCNWYLQHEFFDNLADSDDEVRKCDGEFYDADASFEL